MTIPAILSVASAVPDNRYEQMDLYRQMSHIYTHRYASQIFGAMGIETRYSVISDPAWHTDNPSTKVRNDLYLETAPPLAIKVIQKVLDRADLRITDIDNFTYVTCTGLDTPSMDIIIAEKMDMPYTIHRATMTSMGCHAVLTALRQAHMTVLARPKTKALIVGLELCTIHSQNALTVKSMIGSALFSDGASAVIVGDGASDSYDDSIALIDSLSYSDYKNQHAMSFHPSDTGYAFHLSNQVPKIIRNTMPSLVSTILDRNGMIMNDIHHWMVHPGGMKIVDFVEEELGFKSGKLDCSRAILREYGNMSSATIMFVLERLLDETQPLQGDYGMLISFGPGLTIEIYLLQW
ncbi:MAG: hypothetical protein B6242_00645 [Anaerolineaceae bacterium 4572_78]|nr:MAG: hypothetical protein B6242_00645 [Anaerolineaceae bacterium 4572_78]